MKPSKQYTFLETLKIFLFPLKENRKLLKISMIFFLSELNSAAMYYTLAETENILRNS